MLTATGFASCELEDHATICGAVQDEDEEEEEEEEEEGDDEEDFVGGAAIWEEVDEDELDMVANRLARQKLLPGQQAAAASQEAAEGRGGTASYDKPEARSPALPLPRWGPSPDRLP